MSLGRLHAHPLSAHTTKRRPTVGTHKRILVGVGVSPRLDDALALAVLLSRVLEAELLLAPVHPSKRLKRLANETEPLALVLGSPHRRRIRQVIQGDTAERLLAGAHCPLAIPPLGYGQRDRHALETVGCAFDTSDLSRRSIQLSAQLARSADATLVLIAVHERLSFSEVSVTGAVGVYESANSVLRDQLRAALEDQVAELDSATNVHGLLRDGSPRRTLAALSDELDLLVIGPGSLGSRWSVLTGSATRSLIHDARCPVITVPRRHRGQLALA
jgi:nucleotide-binding universal stress UspA family protein